MDKRDNYRPDIDGLRAVAVLCVLVYHFDLFRLTGGFVGVDVFFVISGYLITLKIVREIEQTGRLNFAEFYMSRVRRLFPALFATVLLTTIFSFLLLTSGDFQNYGGSLVHTLASVSNFYFWNQSGYFDSASELKPLLHTWSLSVEEQFYLIWPLLLVALARSSGFRFLWLLMIVLIGASLYANRVFAQQPEAIFFLTPFRVFEFAIGAGLVAFRNRRITLNWVLEIAVVVGLAAIAYAAINFDDATVFPYRAALIPCIGAALVILGGQARWSGLLLRNRLAVAIGKISYSLYLVHWPIIVLYRYYRLDELVPAETWTLATIAFALSVVMYFGVERPTRHLRIITGSAYGLGCAMLTLFLMYIGAAIWGYAGLPWRVSLPEGDLRTFVWQGGGEGNFHRQNYGGEKCGQPHCAFPGPGGDKFVVVGDSHGRMYFAGLSELTAPATGFSVFEGGGCSFVSEESKCPGRDQAAQYIADGTVDVGVLAQSWTRGNYETQLLGRPEAQRTGDPEGFAAYYVDAITQTLTTGYLAPLRHLVIIGEVPQFAGQSDAVRCIGRPAFLISQERLCDVGVIADWPELQGRQRFNKLLATGLAASPVADRITFLDPFDALCDATSCRQIEDGRLIYSDDDHLSKYGSAVVVDYFRDALIDALQITPAQ